MTGVLATGGVPTPVAKARSLVDRRESHYPVIGAASDKPNSPRAHGAELALIPKSDVARIRLMRIRVLSDLHREFGRISLPEVPADVVVLASAAYVSKMDNLISEQGPALWIHGHINENRDYMIGDTRILNNAHGYPVFFFSSSRCSEVTNRDGGMLLFMDAEPPLCG